MYKSGWSASIEGTPGAMSIGGAPGITTSNEECITNHTTYIPLTLLQVGHRYSIGLNGRRDSISHGWYFIARMGVWILARGQGHPHRRLHQTYTCTIILNRAHLMSLSPERHLSIEIQLHDGSYLPHVY